MNRIVSRTKRLLGMVFALCVAGELRAVEVHVTQPAGRIALGFVVEMSRPRVAALAPGRHGLRAHAVNGTGMLGCASSKCGAMSSLIRWKRLISPQGVFQVPKSAVSASTAAASGSRRSAGLVRDVVTYCMTEMPAACASRT